jgi:hypothetical protein
VKAKVGGKPKAPVKSEAEQVVPLTRAEKLFKERVNALAKALRSVGRNVHTLSQHTHTHTHTCIVIPPACVCISHSRVLFASRLARDLTCRTRVARHDPRAIARKLRLQRRGQAVGRRRLRVVFTMTQWHLHRRQQPLRRGQMQSEREQQNSPSLQPGGGAQHCGGLRCQ